MWDIVIINFVEKICGFLAAMHIPKNSEGLFVSLQRLHCNFHLPFQFPKNSEGLFVSLQRLHCRFNLPFQFRVVFTLSALVFHFYVSESEDRVPYRLPFSSACMEDKGAKRFSFNNFFQNSIMFMDRRQVCVYSFGIWISFCCIISWPP